MKVAIYSGTIPSTVFIERLIEGLAGSGTEILLHGRILKKTNYESENIRVIGYDGNLSKLRVALKYLVLFLLANPKQLFRLGNNCPEGTRFFTIINWFVRVAPIVWHKPDLFHLQWARGIEDWIFLKEFGIKVVLSLRGMHINVSPVFDRKLAETYLKYFPAVDGFHGVSKAICEEAGKYSAPSDKCSVVFSGLNLNNFSFNGNKGRNEIIRIISIGRPHWKKGYVNALDAVKLLLDSGVSLEYRIIGGQDEELIYQVIELGLENKVTLEGSVSFEEVLEAASNSDILLLPSYIEGMPNVVLEAMALGTVVVATNCGGVPEVIQDGQNGFLVPIRNPLAISNKIQEVISLSQVELDLIKQNARATIEKQHKIERMVDGMKELYAVSR